MKTDGASFNRRVWYGALVVVGLIAYANGFGGVFLFDDERNIVENELVHDIARHWRRLLSGSRPLVDLSLAVNYAIGGLNTLGYHVVNVTVHLLAGLTLFGILHRTQLPLPLMERAGVRVNPQRNASTATSEGFSHQDRLLATSSPASGAGRFHLAGLIALVWLVHPLQTQAVTYIIQRAESMMGLFYLLTLYCAIRTAAVEQNGRQKRLWFTAAVIACAAGMTSKAVTVTAPVMIFLYDYTFGSSHVIDLLRRRWKLYAALAATWIVLLATNQVGNLFFPSAGSTPSVGFGYQGVSSWEYLRSQPGVILHYLWLCVWPRHLCLDYQWPVAETTSEIYGLGIVILVLVGASVWGLLRRRWWGFAGAWFFVILAPTSSFIPIKDLAFEHRMYLPLAGVAAVAIIGIGAGMLRPFSVIGMQTAPLRRIGWVAALLVVAALTRRTQLRNRDYCSALQIWQSVIELQPNNARAHSDLGVALIRAGRLRESIPHYSQAMTLDPTYFQAPFNLGNALRQLGRHDAAILRYKDALKIEPNYPRAHINLGKLLADQRKYDEAARHFEAALRVWPDNAEALGNLGAARLGQALPMKSNQRWVLMDEAIARLRRAVEMSPKAADLRSNLGWALLERADLPAAESMFREALALEPDNAGARQGLEAVRKSRRK